MRAEPLVNLEIAKELKGIGFDWNTIYCYKTNSNISDEGDTGSCYHYEDFGDTHPIDWNNKTSKHYPEGYFSRPNLSFAAQYFREVHDLYVWVQPLQPLCKEFVYRMHDLGSNKAFGISQRADKVSEKALSLGLLEAIEIVKKRRKLQKFNR